MGYVTSSTGRNYWVDEDGVAHRVGALAPDETEAEMRAEFAMSWVAGGGRPEDASAAYRQHVHGLPGLPEDDGTCEHGLSASLCAGPGHYPMDY